jgi:hypothetical protein
MECERRWYYERVLKLPVPESPYLEIGKYYHTLIEQTINQGKVPRVTPNKVTELAERWGEKPAAMAAEMSMNLQRLSKEVLRWIKPRRVEAWFHRKDMHIAGVIDLVSAVTPVTDHSGKIIGTEPGPCVLDWKIKFKPTRTRRTQDDADKSCQLGLYALEASTEFAGFVEIPRDITKPIKTFVTEFDEADKPRLARYLAQQFEAMRARGIHEAAYRLAERGSPLCSAKWCPHFQSCPGGEGKKE